MARYPFGVQADRYVLKKVQASWKCAGTGKFTGNCSRELVNGSKLSPVHDPGPGSQQPMWRDRRELRGESLWQMPQRN